MTRAELLGILKSEGLIELGMRADTVRALRHPGRVVTYCGKSEAASSNCVPILFASGESHENLVHTLEELHGTAPHSIQPIFTPDTTGAEYLTRVAACRLYFANTWHVEVNPSAVGMKLAQLALRFGANDFGGLDNEEYEERYRVLIRDAGFIPRRRDGAYRTLYLQ